MDHRQGGVAKRPSFASSRKKYDFTLLKFIHFLLLRNQVCDERLFAFRQSIDLEALNVLLLFFDHLVNALWINIHRDRILLKSHPRERCDDPGKGPAGTLMLLDKAIQVA